MDEILARHIAPIANHAREIISHKYYKDAEGGLKSKLEEILIQEKRKAPGRIPYFFSCAKQLPGKFMLGNYICSHSGDSWNKLLYFRILMGVVTNYGKHGKPGKCLISCLQILILHFKIYFLSQKTKRKLWNEIILHQCFIVKWFCPSILNSHPAFSFF